MTLAEFLSCCEMLETMDRGDVEPYGAFIKRVLDRELTLIHIWGARCRASGGTEVLCNIAGNQFPGDVKFSYRTDVGVFGAVNCWNCSSPFMTKNPNCLHHEPPGVSMQSRCTMCRGDSRDGNCSDGGPHISGQNLRGTATFVSL